MRPATRRRNQRAARGKRRIVGRQSRVNLRAVARAGVELEASASGLGGTGSLLQGMGRYAQARLPRPRAKSNEEKIDAGPHFVQAPGLQSTLSVDVVPRMQAHGKRLIGRAPRECLDLHKAILQVCVLDEDGETVVTPGAELESGTASELRASTRARRPSRPYPLYSSRLYSSRKAMRTQFRSCPDATPL